MEFLIMRRTLFIIILLFISHGLFGQNRSYTGDDGDCLILQGETVFLKLSNHDAFDSFSIYYGKGSITNKRCCKTRRELVLWQNQVDSHAYELDVNKHQLLQQTQIRIMHCDGTPIEYADVAMLSDNDILLYHGRTNLEGILLCEDEIVKKSKFIEINSLGMSLRVENHLAIQSENIIKCLIPYPFIKIGNETMKISWMPRAVAIRYNGKTHHLRMQEQSLPLTYELLLDVN